MAINHGMGYSHNMCQDNIFMARHKEPMLFTNIPSNQRVQKQKAHLAIKIFQNLEAFAMRTFDYEEYFQKLGLFDTW
jgi:hypothetical protein